MGGGGLLLHLLEDVDSNLKMLSKASGQRADARIKVVPATCRCRTERVQDTLLCVAQTESHVVNCVRVQKCHFLVVVRGMTRDAEFPTLGESVGYSFVSTA